jgi:hypothetical protein
MGRTSQDSFSSKEQNSVGHFQAKPHYRVAGKELQSVLQRQEHRKSSLNDMLTNHCILANSNRSGHERKD